MRAYRAAKLHAAMQGLSETGAQASTAAASSTPQVAAEVVEPARTVVKKCSDVLDQGDEGTFPLLPLEVIGKFRNNFERIIGLEPEDSARPTAEQLSAARVTRNLRQFFSFLLMSN